MLELRVLEAPPHTSTMLARQRRPLHTYFPQINNFKESWLRRIAPLITTINGALRKPLPKQTTANPMQQFSTTRTSPRYANTENWAQINFVNGDFHRAKIKALGGQQILQESKQVDPVSKQQNLSSRPDQTARLSMICAYRKHITTFKTPF